ncbi:hypothetical protein [Ruminiclostridium papyrosolvens]|uniref:Butirosin biosynthesis protein H N-terminal domain-containing protein n=1 Tax=Ruminiclostridium papyrosolvens C7 TaxID=1330534 RepID=U4QWQ6_9FIRM|nr:hypothetical protein [Ruminiclostridium papyrosolvens]EPR07708.1 hypothetical protein L323_19455 [Ruminiclostridium papyrosolvens C7]
MELELNQPPINCYLHHAYPLTVAMSHKDFNSWFFSNYIQLQINVKYYFLNFFTYPICGNSILSPLIDYKILDLEFIYKSNTNIIDFIKSSLNLGYYVMTYTDEFFIPHRVSYMKKHFRHEIMIYGYNLDNSLFHVIGYNDTGTYYPSCVSFSEFENSFLNSIKKTNDIILMKAKDNTSYRPSYEFDMENVKNLLFDYIFSKNTSFNLRTIGTPNNLVYGISVYDQLIKYYENILKNDSEEECDIRHFHLLYEHKKTMVSRLEYFVEKKYIDTKNNFINIFYKLENEALNNRNILIKYNITKNKNKINTVIESLHEMYKEEKKTIEDLLTGISS